MTSENARQSAPGVPAVATRIESRRWSVVRCSRPLYGADGAAAGPGAATCGSGSSSFAGLYASGWLRRGPSGAISTNKTDAEQVVSALLADWEEQQEEGEGGGARGGGDLLQELEGVVVVDHAAWKRIDAAEVAAAREGAPREKLVVTEEQLAVATAAA